MYLTTVLLVVFSPLLSLTVSVHIGILKTNFLQQQGVNGWGQVCLIADASYPKLMACFSAILSFQILNKFSIRFK